MKWVLLLSAVLCGCPSPQSPRQEDFAKTTLVLAKQVRFADVLCAERVRATGDVHLKQACAQAYHVARATLISAQSMLDAWEDRHANAMGCALASVCDQVLHVVQAVEASGGAAPDLIVETLSTVRPSLGECHDDGDQQHP